ncbi:BON domain-containing protein [Aeromonas salmonicida]|uniref:BON domain-containing protein n=1 Tax=Aeromonas salmonicida TaxID=645 RepID=UPI00073B5975|nr:BON domain-containing protein [Aeromonas salmonicida]KTA81417.1 transporter [Aeromonas salmonicida]MCE9967624.1 BON domain-containing protein [Aeromonas salmonicida]MDE7527782.1 BON domain-containing protein [Aeromonas salmonicida]MDE7532028.1 BON domain-containing protein [Aeromonas salmonicida]
MIQSKAILIAFSLLLTLGVSGCDQPGSAEQAGKKIDDAASETGKKVDATVDKYEDKMTEQTAKSAQSWNDTEVTAKVKAEFLSEPGLKSMDISVNTVQGMVTLTGTVDSRINSDKASARAMAISGVKGVVNQLVVTAVQ